MARSRSSGASPDRANDPLARMIVLSDAIFAFAIAQKRGEKRWMFIGWAACAAAVLSKGLIGIVLPAATVALYVLVRRDWRLLGRLEFVRGGLLFLAICAPWFIAVSAANREFAYFFFVQEHFLRFTTTMHQRSQPGWYFVTICTVGMRLHFGRVSVGQIEISRIGRLAEEQWLRIPSHYRDEKFRSGPR